MKSNYRESSFVRLTAFTLFAATVSFAQESVSPPIDFNRNAESWTGGTIEDAMSQSKSKATIPMSHYTFKVPSGPKAGTYKGVLVGGNPFASPTPVTIDAVLIPLIIAIAKPDGTIVTFDPSVGDPCDPNGLSAQTRFMSSPLVIPIALTFNGVFVGLTQYIDGFMQAEFWKTTGGSSSYSNLLNWSVSPPVLFGLVEDSSVAIVEDGGCSPRGIVSQATFSTVMKTSVIPYLQGKGVISPTKFAFFLTKNVVTSSSTPPTTTGILGGQHYATGSPVQTWARASYNVAADVRTASHEIGEWMNDPLLTNSTPPWGHEGEVKNCSHYLEVGDPTNGIDQPIVNMFGYNYHVQELAFFSWFYDASGTASLGAGGKFSGNGKFTGPSMPCPPGGTYTH